MHTIVVHLVPRSRFALLAEQDRSDDAFQLFSLGFGIASDASAVSRSRFPTIRTNSILPAQAILLDAVPNESAERAMLRFLFYLRNVLSRAPPFVHLPKKDAYINPKVG